MVIAVLILHVHEYVDRNYPVLPCSHRVAGYVGGYAEISKRVIPPRIYLQAFLDYTAFTVMN